MPEIRRTTVTVNPLMGNPYLGEYRYPSLTYYVAAESDDEFRARLAGFLVRECWELTDALLVPVEVVASADVPPDMLDGIRESHPARAECYELNLFDLPEDD